MGDAECMTLPAALERVAGLGGHSFIGVITSRPLGSWCEPLDEGLWRARTRWIACELTDSSLILGPHINPGATACMRCATQRRISNLADRAAIDEHGLYTQIFERDPAAQIRGFLPSLVDIAAGSIAAAAQERGLAPGRIRELMLENLQMIEGQVSGLHGCKRCRTARFEDPSDRFIADLRRVMRDGDGRD